MFFSSIKIKPGTTYHAVFETAANIGAVQSVEMSWKSAISSIKLEYIDLNSEIKVVQSEDVTTKLRLAHTKILADETVTALTAI